MLHPKVASIAITTQPTKTTYIEGQSFDPTGMVVTVTNEDDDVYTVTNYTYSPSGALATTDTKVTVSYGGKTADVSITVNAKVVESIAVTTQPTKTSYVEGQVFDPTGMVVTATYNDETTAVVTEYTYSPTTALATTDDTITVSYSGKTADVTIEVVEKVVESIAITTQPTKTSYTAGETFDPTGMVVTATYNDETTAVVSEYTYSPSGELATTDTAVTVSYSGKTATVDITVAE